MKIYVTKYLFTEGIQEYDASDAGKGFMNAGEHGLIGPDNWYGNRDEAIVHAEKLRAKKLAALDKQRKKIEAMSFA